VGLAIAAVLIAGFQLRPQNILPSTGVLQIALTDGAVGVTIMNPPSTQSCHPTCNATSLVVTVTTIEVHTAGVGNMTGEWTSVCADKLPMTLNITQLHNVSTLICGARIQPDTITNVRLNVSSAMATIPTLGPQSLAVPSGKLEIPISPLGAVEAGKITTIVVEFQPHIICTGVGSCKLTPVLHAVPQGPD